MTKAVWSGVLTGVAVSSSVLDAGVRAAGDRDRASVTVTANINRESQADGRGRGRHLQRRGSRRGAAADGDRAPSR